MTTAPTRPPGYNKPIKRFADRAVMMMMGRTKKAVDTPAAGWREGREGRKDRQSRADLFTAKRLNRRHAEREGEGGKEGGRAVIVFLPPCRPSRWMTVVRLCPEGFYYVLPFSERAAGLWAELDLGGI